jgi:hypothetical protein
MPFLGASLSCDILEVTRAKEGSTYVYIYQYVDIRKTLTCIPAQREKKKDVDWGRCGYCSWEKKAETMRRTGRAVF